MQNIHVNLQCFLISLIFLHSYNFIHSTLQCFDVICIQYCITLYFCMMRYCDCHKHMYYSPVQHNNILIFLQWKVIEPTDLFTQVDHLAVQSIPWVTFTAGTGSLQSSNKVLSITTKYKNWQEIKSVLTLFGPTWTQSALTWQPPFPSRQGLISEGETQDSCSTQTHHTSCFFIWQCDTTSVTHRHTHIVHVLMVLLSVSVLHKYSN